MKRIELILVAILFCSILNAQDYCRIGYDKSRILNNENLSYLISELKKENLATKNKSNAVPRFILKELRCIIGRKFSIANIGKPYQETCTSKWSLPERGLTYLGMNENYILMTYLTGGLYTTGHVLIIKYKNEQIIDLWKGFGFGLNDKDSTMQYLENSREKGYLLNTGDIYW